MEAKRHEKRICKFCGRERQITIITDDGCDYMGHARGPSSEDVYDNGCDCTFGKLEASPAEVERMCYNCYFYRKGSCTNAERLDDLSEILEIGPSVKVAHPEKHCGYHRLNPNIFLSLVKKGV